MKKFLCILTAVLLCTSLALPGMAAGSVSIPSNGFAIETATLDGEDVTGCLLVTPVPQAVSGDSLLDADGNELLVSSYDGLADGSMEIPGIGDAQVNYLELSDLRFKDGACEIHGDHAALREKLDKGEAELTVTAKLDVAPESDVYAYILADGEWVATNCKSTQGMNLITVTVNRLGAIVFLEKEEREDTKPAEDVTPNDSDVSVAGDASFVPSVTYKGNPTIISAGSNMAVEGTDDIKNCIVVTSVTQALTNSTDISQADRDQLLELYEGLKNGTMSLPLAKNHVIRELVDISFRYEGCEKIDTHGNKGLNLSEDGVTLTLTLSMDLSDGVVPHVMSYIDGKWESIKSVKLNEDGTLTCVFEDIGPVAFVVGESPNNSSPFTGDAVGQNLGIWIGLMVVCAAGLVAVVILMRKKNK